MNETYGVGIIRIIIGILVIYHGIEVFGTSLMQEYMSWERFEGPNAKLMVY
jgi:putative oxidoreductase